MTAPAFALTSERRWTVPETLSDADPYRFLFGWTWAPGPLVVFVGLNPSTMTAEKTDATGRKWRGFAERLGFGGYIAVNCFGFRSKNPTDLIFNCGGNSVGPGNDDAIRAALAFPGVTKVIACWGKAPFVPLKPRLAAVRKMLTDAGHVYCWGVTQCGEPRHPLYLPWSLPLERLWP